MPLCSSSSSLLHTFSLLKLPLSLPQLLTIHTQLIVRDALSSSLSLSSRLVSAYISLNSPFLALKTLSSLPPSPFSLHSWNSLIKLSPLNSFSLLRSLLRLSLLPDSYTFPFVLKACADPLSLPRGTSIHALVIPLGLDYNVYVSNSLVAMYGRCGDLGNARKVFDEMLERKIDDLVTWNSIFACYVQNGDPGTGLRIFEGIGENSGFGFGVDAVSLVSIFPACAYVASFSRGKEAHGYAMRTGLIDDVFVGNAVVDMYAKMGFMGIAKRVFEMMGKKDVVSWNAMVSGYARIGKCNEAIRLFEKMNEEKVGMDVVTWSAVISGYAQRGCGFEAIEVFRKMSVSGARPNVVTLVSLLSGCASVGALNQGRESHCYAIKRVLGVYGSDNGDDLMVINGVIDMYSKCKSSEVARALFDSIDLRYRNVVTWTAMIGGYAQQGDANEALDLFSVMMRQEDPRVLPNPFTISCVLMACARLAALRLGKQVHAYVFRNNYDTTILFIANCLIDMYAKSGDVNAARVVFDNMRQRNSVSWTSLMAGYGMHGRGDESFKVFNEMKRAGLEIDGVTFVVLLYACSHSGMVDKGISYFDNMSTEFNVVPGVEHYACMVDLLGRAGRFDEVMKLIEDMPMEPSPVIWFSLLGACRNHSKVELGEYAANKLLELKCYNDGSYTLLSNLYANARQWKDVAKVRSLMRNTGIRKRPGCSWVQGKKGTASFYVGDRYHPLSLEINKVLADLIQRIKAIGYVPETSFALHDVDDEEKGDLLFEHSEKLALAYGILTTPSGVPIRITKNLRVCGDCHTAFTYISRIIDHEIILRDSSRFHHFKNGTCSCRGFW